VRREIRRNAIFVRADAPGNLAVLVVWKCRRGATWEAVVLTAGFSAMLGSILADWWRIHVWLTRILGSYAFGREAMDW